MFDTDAVFHAPMFALNADAERKACEPNRTWSTPTESAQTLRRGYVCTQTHAHARAHTLTWTLTYTRGRPQASAGTRGHMHARRRCRRAQRPRRIEDRH
jgi:hypothetical protein